MTGAKNQHESETSLLLLWEKLFFSLNKIWKNFMKTEPSEQRTKVKCGNDACH